MTDYVEQARINDEMTRVGNGSDPFSSAVRATRMPMIITDPRQADNPIVFVNDAFCRLTGFAREEIEGRNCRFLQGPGTDRGEVGRLRDAIEHRVTIELELLNYRKDQSTFWNRLLVSPVFDAEGELTYFFASQFDVTVERERLSELEREVESRDVELRASEQRFRFALHAGRLGSWSYDPSSGELLTSDMCKEIFGHAPSAPFTYADLQSQVHPADRDRRDKALAKAIASGGEFDVEYRISTPAGEERWVAIRAQAYLRADGSPLSVVGVSQDITERKRAEEHRILLTNELNHRVKNTLATLQSIIAQTLRHAGSLEDAAETLSARVMAMSAANDLLVNQEWGTAPIADLLQRTLAPFGVDDDGRFILSGPDLRLPAKATIALGLGLHELATNASKYGALSARGGRVRLDWSLIEDTHPPLLHLTWSEEGGPPVKAPTSAGFGTRLIERVLASQIGGRAEIKYPPEGVTFTAYVTLPNEPADA